MTQFNISRLHTRAGTFRLSGVLSYEAKGHVIQYSKVEAMGTDGWCELDITSLGVRKALAEIHTAVIAHLSTLPS
ncbi:hypothetical protein L1286_20310 [Pseudoalteromonas sp. SMS1]|uniref:hypothetical protein n=1 Tax=Pseudoalteromonas sp. SMS1 TaxID=2908894 RepID=UPI001F33774E|nr:hypothetical protein [Pseudoalteromonas sp. SMS1]MCF2859830.1 hypothetical protein [Pseudoalteromonas sp. SMS1]